MRGERGGKRLRESMRGGERNINKLCESEGDGEREGGYKER
jgi:hypothetical protein